MKKYSWLTPVSILIFVLVTLIFLSTLAFPKDSKWPIKQRLNLGLDLKGGTQIVLTVKGDGMTDQELSDAVDNNIKIINSRINQYGVLEPTIQKLGTSDILVQLPGVQNPMEAQKLLTKSAILSFKLVASAEDSQRFIDQLDGIIQANLSRFPALTKLNADYQALDSKADAVKDTTAAEGQTEPGIFKSLITTAEYDNVVRYDDLDIMYGLLADSTFINLKPKGYDLVLENVDATKRLSQEPVVIYVLKSTAEIMGTDLEKASMEMGSTESRNANMAGKPYISLSFKREGARKFANVTGAHIEERLAIVVDNMVYSAPRIQDKIPDGKATITGSFSLDEAKSLAILLNNKSFSAPIEPKYSNQISASLGSDSIKSSLMAGLIGILAVVLFMLFYYKLCGLVADFVLIFNVGFILAILTAFGGTLTLPGIAGIILTIGMAVDANVLIFERIREELDAGKTPRSAADAGFKRASVTIWDANLTTLIAAIVLYQFGTGPIRGFALTLTIGVVGSIFSAIVFVRFLIDKTMLAGNRKKLSI